MKVQFPNGVAVCAVGLADREQNTSWRTYGLYLDARWSPTWPAMVLRWPDFGLPEDWVDAADQIRHAYRLASNGEHVEVGCAGGLGRTGTVLACMAILAGVAPEHAVAWVRATYDRRAVETDEQSSWVQWFGSHVSQSQKERSNCNVRPDEGV